MCVCVRACVRGSRRIGAITVAVVCTYSQMARGVWQCMSLEIL